MSGKIVAQELSSQDADKRAITGTEYLSENKRALDTNILGTPAVQITDGAGVVNTKQLGNQLTTNDVGLITNTIIHGLSTSGGGGFVDVKVTPSGAMSVEGAPIDMAISTDNNRSTVIANGDTWSGTWEDATGYNTITVAAKTDQAGVLYIEFSPDGTNADSSLSFNTAASVNEVHRLTVTRRYFRIRFTNNSGSAQSYFRLQTLKGNHPLLTSALNSTIQDDADTILTRSILYGKHSDGTFADVPIDDEGHLEVSIHNPRLPFGSLHTESLRPIFQFDGVYSLHPATISPLVSGSGTTGVVDSMMYCSTGTTVYSQGIIQSRKRMRYRPGQGMVARFTAMYTTPVADSYQLAGVGHPEDGVYFGYKNLEFGILYVAHGVRECRTLTITTASTTNENVTVNLNGTNYSVAVTNSGNIQRTVWEISQGDFGAWKAEAVGATIVFVASSVGVKAGAFTLTATTAVGTFAQTKAGAASTDTWIPQSSWNGDKLDGTGTSTYNIDPTKLNVFQIDLQYLGAGAVVFKVETVQANSVNAVWTVAHILRLPNTLTKPTFSNPSLPFTMAAYSAGSTTNLTVKSASVGAFQEGTKYMHGPRYSYFNSLTTVGSANYQALFTIKNSVYMNGKTNQTVINLLDVLGALKHTSPCIFYLINNGRLGGNPNFTRQDNYSAATYDTSATTVTIASQSQIVWSGHLGDTGNLNVSSSLLEDFTIEPGEWITLAAKAVTGSPSFVTGSINTREDQ